MDKYQVELNRFLSDISTGNQPDELPADIPYRGELMGVWDRISFLSDEKIRQEAESATLRCENQRISLQEQLYRSVFEHAVIGIMIVSSDNRIINVNQAVEYMLGYQAFELTDMGISDFILPDDHSVDAELRQDIIEGRRNYYQIEKRYTRNDGMLFWSMVTVSVIQNASGELYFIHMLEDISARKSAELQLEQASTQDAMTGLYNRAYFDREFSRLQYSMRLPVSIIVVDVDGLKLLNDSKGHEAGDRLIVTVAAILKEAFRGDDTVARVGGDEFSILLPETGVDALHVVIDRVRRCQARFNEASPDFQVNFSIGSATALNGDDIPKTLKQADERMYADKVMRKGIRAVQEESRKGNL